MGGEIIIGAEIVDSPESIKGRDFRIPLIRWNGSDYKFEGLHLPSGWGEEIPRLSGDNPENYHRYLESLCQGNRLNWELHFDKKTGLVTEIKFTDDKQNSRVYLSTRLGISGIYIGEGIQNLRVAIICQDFLAHYLGWVTNYQKIYPYIAAAENNQWGSVDLAVLQKVYASKELVTGEDYQHQFEIRASNIAGQFGRTLRYVNFDGRGVLQVIQIDEEDCNYHLSGLYGEYFSHNVDSMFQAAALHGITAEFINDLLSRK